MGPRTVVELAAAIACVTFGARLWFAEDPAAPALVLNTERTTTSEAAPLARPAAPEGRETAAPIESSRPDASRTASAVPAADLTATSASSPPPATAGVAYPSTTAIAPLPPLAGPPAPRIPEALARVALRYVGKDAGAEAMWRDAIDDPGMSEEARSDLIEDLNEEGYRDGDRPGAADLPLILARLRLVERLAPSAMDDVNAAAFAEAYKDLVEMLVRLREESTRAR